MENGKDSKILTTNRKASFWRNLKRILKQNIGFLFGRDLEEKIQILESRVTSLQERIIQLENLKDGLRDQNKGPEARKTIQQEIKR